jgi:hypothetical protein
MSLTKDEIIKNARIYFKTAEKYGFMTDSLIKFLGENFIKAPLFPSQSQCNAFEVGLIDHILRVTKYAIALNDLIEPQENKSPKESIVKICFLYQIGRAHLYKRTSNERGILYEYNPMITMNICERSLFYALNNGVSLDEKEYASIISFDNPATEQMKWYNTIMGDILKMANTLAIKEEEKIYNK